MPRQVQALLGSLMQAIADREPVHVLSHGTRDLERAVGISDAVALSQVDQLIQELSAIRSRVSQ